VTAITINSDGETGGQPPAPDVSAICTDSYTVLTFTVPSVYTGRSTNYSLHEAPPLDTTQEALCSLCGRPLLQPGAVCQNCGKQPPGAFHVQPLFLVLVVLLAAIFCTATIFAARFYQAKQLQLGQMYFGRGQAALAAGQPHPAIQDFRDALYYSHDDPEYRLRLAEALVAADRIPEAQSYLLTLWQDEPSNSTVNLQLARLAAKQDNTQAALRYYHGAIYGLWPEAAAAARRLQTRLELIHYLLGLHDTTQADGELIALTSELPRNAAAHVQVGRLFLQTGDQERALQQFQHALHLDPRDASAALGAGQAAFDLGQYRSAERYLDRAARLRFRSSQVQELLITTRLILGLDPYQQGLSSSQRARRIAQSFNYAQQRLRQCAAAKGISLQAASAPATQAGLKSSAPNNGPAAAAPARQSAAGLMAKILGRVEGSPVAPPPPPAPATQDAVQMQQLAQEMSQKKRNVRTYKLERDPQLADSVLQMVSQAENLTAQQCGSPRGADLALLLLSRQGEQR
jgi:tetratricopeptide (TPR) repeat protein